MRSFGARDGRTFLPDCDTSKNAQILHFAFDDICTVRHERCMARHRPKLTGPMYGFLPREAYNAEVALYDRLKAYPSPPHRPPSLDTFARQLCIIHAVATLKALDPARKIRGDIAKQVAKYYGVSETWVFAVRTLLDPKLRATIETKAEYDVRHALRFADHSAVEDWRKSERRFTDARLKT
jgi:hypothetical protein